MSSSSLEHKTIRPGSMVGYSYYHSNRIAPGAGLLPAYGVKPNHRKAWLVTAFVILAAAFLIRNVSSNPKLPLSTNTAPAATAITPSITDKINYCAGNTQDKLIVISIKQRHLWACQGTKSIRDTSVITGLQHHPETETPLGSYKIYGKTTNTTLKGSDSRGAWNDPVYYWMPFLDNQYGTYGFHDATWRAEDAFGKVSPDSPDASHGCVELPLADSKWLYEWTDIGTAVTVKA